MVKLKIDLNSDLGESFGHFRIGHDEEIMQFITSANIACVSTQGTLMLWHIL